MDKVKEDTAKEIIKILTNENIGLISYETFNEAYHWVYDNFSKCLTDMQEQLNSCRGGIDNEVNICIANIRKYNREWVKFIDGKIGFKEEGFQKACVYFLSKEKEVFNDDIHSMIFFDKLKSALRFL
jgi:hypothetical protein